MFNILTNVRGQIVGGLTALLMGGMSVFSFAQAGGHESVLKIIPHADLKNLDPIWTTAYISRNHGYMIYDTLLQWTKVLHHSHKWLIHGPNQTME